MYIVSMPEALSTYFVSVSIVHKATIEAW